MKNLKKSENLKETTTADAGMQTEPGAAGGGKYYYRMPAGSPKDTRYLVDFIHKFSKDSKKLSKLAEMFGMEKVK